MYNIFSLHNRKHLFLITVMDISIGSYKSDASFTQRAKSIWLRLTMRAKVILGVLLLMLLYFFWPSSSSSTQISGKSGGRMQSKNAAGDINSISNILNDGSQFSSINLSYMNIPPLLDVNAQYPNYSNGGNMLLSRKSSQVRLVNDNSEKNGYLSSRNTISYSDLNAIEIELEFKIHGSQDRVTLIGDGMAIWLTSDPIQTGTVFGAASSWDGLGIFIDTYKNFNGKRNRNVFPYLSLQRNYGDPNFYDKAMDGLDSQLGGCSVSEIYNNANPSKMKITYIRSLKIFEISADIRGDNNWKVCFRREDSSVEDYLPMGRNIYLSVSAETGQLHHIVDIENIKVTSFKTLDESEIKHIDRDNVDFDKDDTSKENDKPVIRKPRRTMNRLRRQEKKLREADYEKYGTENGFVGWFFGIIWMGIWTILKIVFILALIYGAVLAFRVYKDKQKKKNSGGLF